MLVKVNGVEIHAYDFEHETEKNEKTGNFLNQIRFSGYSEYTVEK